MPPAAVAIGTAAASIGGSILGSRARESAANDAADAQAENTAANNALAREMYGNNSARLDPFVQNGLRASNQLNAMLLGAPRGPATRLPGAPAPGVRPGGGPPPATGPGSARGNMVNNALSDAFYGPNGFQRNGFGPRPNATAPRPPATTPAANPNAATVNPQQPWDVFRNSTNYQWRLNQGMKGLNQSYAANGMLESGAAMKGIVNYGQNFASNELNNYLGLLGQQQGMGLSAGSALAGVGTQMVGQVTANNTAGADAASNAALMRGSANANMYAGIGGSLGRLFGGSSYGGG